jgi:glutamine synthetase
MPDVSKIVEKENVKDIILQFTDISGALHSLWVPAQLFSRIADEGVHFDGSSVAMVDISESDLKLIPELNTFRILPQSLFPQRVAKVTCDLYEPESDKPFKLSPRFILKKLMKDSMKSLGPSVNYNACSEIEYFVFRKDESGNIRTIDEGGYLESPPTDAGADLRLEIVENLRTIGVLVEKHHHECPPGKSELNLKYSDALSMADTIYLVKFIVKMTTARRGLIASFMPKPLQGTYGCGLHTHVSLTNEKKVQNLFYDSNGKYGISNTALHFLAGILKHARALTALTNPSINSYKRLVLGWEAPVYISWAKYNRSTLIRVPPGKEMTSRIEYRPTDGSCNFYTAFAGILAAGMDGIRKKIDFPEPVEEDIYEMSEKQRVEKGIDVLPGSLGEALKEFSEDKCLQDALGKAFCEKFMEIKAKEWKDFNVAVHEWERKKYLDV